MGGIAETETDIAEATEIPKDLTVEDEPERPQKNTKEEGTTETSEGENDVSGIQYKAVWKNADETVRKGVLELWDDQTGGKMPSDTKEKRLDMVCVVALDGERVVAVSTIHVERSELFWCNIGLFRCLVHQDYRRKGVAKQLALGCKKVLEDHAKNHPGERILAMGMIFSSKILGKRGKKPFWPELGMTLCGYNQHNMQIRVAWFDHVQIEY